ncbi:unnamed protein product, partial [Hapterophycus canaliculatus]
MQKSRPDYRFLVTLGLALGVLCVVIWMRPIRHQGLQEDIFWQRKLSHAPVDLVVAGDSRVLHGVSTQDLQRGLGEIEALNFGFRS